MSDPETLAPYEDEEDAAELENDVGQDDEDGDDDTVASQPPVPIVKSRPVLKTKGKRKPPPGRKSALTEELWTELQALYEGAGYSQRDVVNYVKRRGIVISQAAICRRATENGWVKGAKKAEIREAAFEEIREQVGEGMRKMLEQHANQAMMAEMEVLRHYKAAEDRRKAGDTDYLMPGTILNQVTSAMKMAQELRARAMGFNYREGRPFKIESDDDAGLSTLTVRVMSDEEHDDLKRKGEEQNEEA